MTRVSNAAGTAPKSSAGFVMSAFVAAGLAGLLGRGPLSHRTEQSPASALAVDFEPIARSQAPTQVTFHIANPTDAPTLDLFIGTNSVEPMGLQRIMPQPVSTKGVKDGLVLTLAIPPGTENAEIRLMLEPSVIGENELIAQLAGHAHAALDAVRDAMSVIVRAAAAYLLLLFAVRLIGRRTASMMAPFDLVVLFLFGGALMAGTLGDDHSMTAAVSAVFSIGLMHIAVSTLKRWSPWFGRMVDGTPVVIFERGAWHQDRMRGMRVLESDVMAAVRQKGLMRLEQVRYAVVERDGKVSIVAEPE